MNLTHLLASTLFLLPFQYPIQPHKVPLRNTFVVAAETVIDDAGNIDIKSSDDQFEPQMQQLKAAQATLTRMIGEDGERDVVEATNNLIFAISACHIQAKAGTGTAQCEPIISRARTGAMEAIDKHKSAGAWVDGPPS